MERKHAIFNQMKGCIPDPEQSFGLPVGGWNFSAAGAYKAVGTSGAVVSAHSGTSTSFGSMFSHYIELAQDEYICSRSKSYSRIDRVYTNLRPSDLVDLKPSASAAWSWSGLSPRRFSEQSSEPKGTSFRIELPRVGCIPSLSTRSLSIPEVSAGVLF
jgi:hypothetical protein